MKIADKIFYGGDYNPDQWDNETIRQDMIYFKEAGINLVTLPVFSWAKLEPDEGVYDFGWLDELMNLFAENDISVCLATPTVAQPAWLSSRYPEVLPVDIAGRRRTHGMRVFFCYNSLKYRQRAAAIAEEMAKRYQNHPALAVWHVANEYGTYCYCPICQAQFRVWLRKRYGNIDNLNEKWNTAFWGRTLYSFEEVMLPTELNDDYRFNPAIQLDYMRFVTDSTAECFENEYRVLKKYTPDIPVQTNMSGYIKKLDQFKMAEKMDIIGWDNYPWPTDDRSFIAFKHDIMRGLKNGQSYMLMEQSPNQQNWQPYNKLKRPGEVRLLSYQALAHGADTCLFFQMRQSIGGQEKFHGAVISHAGHNNTRVFREIKQLGHELAAIGDACVGAYSSSKVGILMDWNNWWALELASGPSKDTNYLSTVAKYYRAFYEDNIWIDILGYGADLSGYKIIVAPMLYMLKDNISAKIEKFVNDGGILILTTMSGLVDENDRCVFGAYPGPLRDVAGLWVEETDALFPHEKNGIEFSEVLPGFDKSYSCGFLCDLIHLTTAEPLATYTDDFYAGRVCFSRNHYGAGQAYYIGTEPEQAFLNNLAAEICQQAKVQAPFQADEGVEITVRHTETVETIFIINHNSASACVQLGNNVYNNRITAEDVSGRFELAAYDVAVLVRANR